ncbi:MAG: putative penicillin-binding protein [Candidatus Taylorbacteria bacterium]|nr:putative penicillin-binding protein [Candidatus Taylorbacteria bacterium]
MLKTIDKYLRKIEDFIINGVKKMVGKGKKTKQRKNIWKEILFIVIALFLLCVGGALLWFSSIEIPDLASFDQRILGQSTKIYDKTGQILLYDLNSSVRRTVVPFDQISDNVKHATLAIEDPEFYQHGGIKITAIIRAVFANLSTMEFSQGGSTITQQVVKNSLLTREKTITRKVKEWFLSIKLEKTLTKDQILNLYLNESPYGGTIYGIEEASMAYFNKKSSDLDIAESAYLASIPKSPTTYSPFGNHRDELEARKNLTLSKMKEVGYITDAEYQSAKDEKVTFSAEQTGGIKAPHFVMYIKDYLQEQYGDKMLTEGGLKVITTLDYDMQKKAEEIVKAKAIENGKLWHATNAALVALDSKTGQILTMVGSRDYFDKEIDGNYNVATAKRQPGSSFKPIVYAKAFEMGYRPETTLFDTETQFSTTCAADNTTSDDPCYSPGNYDGKFRGPITLRNALAQSINIPAVKLLYLVGVNNAIDLAEKMGISTLADRARFGLSLVLGGGEVTLLDLTGAYSVFSDNGMKHQTTGILKITDQTGKVLEQYTDNSEQVLEPDTTHLISDVLSDNVARTPIFGAASSLYFPDRQVAAKTGTTNNYRDAWVIGYTPQITVGAWSGNNDNTPIAKQVAGYIVAPMWHEFMNAILPSLPDERFTKPDEKDLSDLKPILRGEWQNDAGVHSILYYIDKSDPLGPAPTNPANDPQFSHWEYGVQKWLGTQGILPTQTPTTSDTTQQGIQLSVITPINDTHIKTGDKIVVNIKTVSNSPIKKVDFFLAGTFLGSSEFPPYGFTFVVGDRVSLGNNILSIVATDSTGAQKSVGTELIKE